MHIFEIGQRIRTAREMSGLSQSRLASLAGVSRTTLSQLESGVIPDIGLRKLQAVLDRVGLGLSLQPARQRATDFVKVAATMGSTSYRERLGEDELIRALLTSRIPAGKRPQLRHLLEEAPRSLIRGLLRQLGGRGRSARLEKHLGQLASDLGVGQEVASRWKLPD